LDFQASSPQKKKRSSSGVLKTPERDISSESDSEDDIILTSRKETPNFEMMQRMHTATESVTRGPTNPILTQPLTDQDSETIISVTPTHHEINSEFQDHNDEMEDNQREMSSSEKSDDNIQTVSPPGSPPRRSGRQRKVPTWYGDYVIGHIGAEWECKALFLVSLMEKFPSQETAICSKILEIIA
jgi:hypothetical protein